MLLRRVNLTYTDYYVTSCLKLCTVKKVTNCLLMINYKQRNLLSPKVVAGPYLDHINCMKLQLVHTVLIPIYS